MSKSVISSPSPAPAAAVWEAPGKPSPEAGELPLMRSGVAELLAILSYARPHDTEGERAFVETWLLPRFKALGFAVEADGFGNLWGEVPAPEAHYGPWVLWSCHIDTVHNASATRQQVRWRDDGRTLELVKRKPGRCLGADDGAGLWLMLEMIAAGVPGGYVFHRGEEKGRLGSLYVAECEADRLNPYDACVAFDRRDYRDLITHQMGERCASDAFADSFCDALNNAGWGLSYIPDNTGSYTDSYSYAHLISECANVSVGYDREHGPNETLDALHLWRLRDAVCSADFAKVVCERDCTVMDYDDAWYRWGTYPGSRTGDAAWAPADFDDANEQLVEFIRRFPAAVADCLELYGLGVDELAEHLSGTELTQAAGAGLLSPVAAGGGGWTMD